jgi:hypothetical protein
MADQRPAPDGPRHVDESGSLIDVNGNPANANEIAGLHDEPSRGSGGLSLDQQLDLAWNALSNPPAEPPAPQTIPELRVKCEALISRLQDRSTVDIRRWMTLRSDEALWLWDAASKFGNPPAFPDWAQRESQPDDFARALRNEAPTDVTATKSHVLESLRGLLDWLDSVAGDQDVEVDASGHDAQAQLADRDITETTSEAGNAAHRDDEAEAVDSAGPGNHDDNGMSWREAQHEAEQIRSDGERFTSYPKMAKRIGCSRSTLHKAIKDYGTVELQEWASKQRGESRLNAAPEVAAVAIENRPQNREADPADITEDADIELTLAYLLDQAKPEERARIHEMDPAAKRQLAETALKDPDHEDQALRHYRAKRSRRG